MPATLERPRPKLKLEPEQHFLFHNATWEQYVRMDAEHGTPGVRFTFCDGLIEVMSISKDHERIKSAIRAMVESWCRMHDVFYDSQASATLSAPGARAGEPDESWSFRRGKEDVDLVVEVAITQGAIDKLNFYAGLKVPEVWIWHAGKLAAYVLERGRYRESSSSRCLPGIDLTAIGQLATSASALDAVTAFERRIKRGR